MIVIVANEIDSHSDAVIISLRERNFDDVLRIDLDNVQERFSVTYSTSGVEGPTVLQLKRIADGASFSSDSFTTVYWRRASGYINRNDRTCPTAEGLDDTELYWGCRLFLENLPAAKFPLGHPFPMRAASNKLSQLPLASNLGMLVPDTIFSNDIPDLVRFCEKHNEVVVKPLHTSLISPDADRLSAQVVTLLAKSIKSEDLVARLKCAKTTTLYCQEKICKVADVRLNVLPSLAIACRIDPVGPDAEIDWRPHTFYCGHEIITIPTGLEEKCREYLRHMNLLWGAFDFGIRDDGEWVFFECNPNGQWLWIELKTRAPLSRTVADILLNHHRQHEIEPAQTRHAVGVSSVG